ncbi:sugar phosphate isomerase/epimerase [Leuconostoc gelidum subsp. aenigmaticum]|uniref:sugar phosphate isomerase/epimerase family protein n=1 Tax=Leuconostoc gelidum TaxID=1244 RepID=UPI001CC4ED4D|nr:sugar phosphate isomerase/epimerase [Leuconostoc gelidum]MBZ6002445.1 sugar phosphate isomerase/epimerase [Leuconostoc gelidum subsp. aenigmaticum]
MKKSQIVLNHLVFASDRENGEQQLDMLKKVVGFGIQSAELRREYFDDIIAETPAIAAYVKSENLRLFYSVPDDLFVNHRVNPKLSQYYHEAIQLGVSVIKFNTGDFETLLPEDIAAIEKILQLGIQTNIENDQTQTSGKMHAIEKFMTAAHAADLAIGYVYDMGNWRYVREDELTAAKQLASYVKYIHVKDDKGLGDKLVTVPLNKGEIAWQEILHILPQNVPVAIEYPTANEQTILDGIQALKVFS